MKKVLFILSRMSFVAIIVFSELLDIPRWIIKACVIIFFLDLTFTSLLPVLKSKAWRGKGTSSPRFLSAVAKSKDDCRVGEQRDEPPVPGEE